MAFSPRVFRELVRFFQVHIEFPQLRFLLLNAMFHVNILPFLLLESFLRPGQLGLQVSTLQLQPQTLL